jgi:hypothetical protein
MQERFELDGYVVDALIGFGGTGEVWRAHEIATGEAVALKRLRSRGAAATERLRREAGLLATLAGPHVIGVRRMVVDETEAVMVLDYAAGGNLATVLAVRGRLPAPEVVTVVGPIAAALAAAHSRNLVHGDITPANILFTAEGRPLLADFGVARALGATNPELEATPDFLDPTIAAGGTPNPAADVFALGAVAFAALAGQSIWGSGTAAEIHDRAVRGERPTVQEIAPEAPPALAEALESMLQLEPGRRPDARSAGHAVLRACAVAPVGLVHTAAPIAAPATHVVRPAPARPAGLEERDRGSSWWTPWRRHVVIAAAAVAALIGAAGAGVGLARAGAGQAHVLTGSEDVSASPAPSAALALQTPTPTPTPTAARTSTASPTSPARPVRSPGRSPSGEAGTAAHGAASRWLALVSHLDALRARAFAEADPAPLAQVYAAHVAAYATDLSTVGSLVSRGLHAEGFTATVVRVRLVAGSATTQRLRVTDRLSSYRLVDAAGNVVGGGAARPPTTFTMGLVRSADGWRVTAINPAS